MFSKLKSKLSPSKNKAQPSVVESGNLQSQPAQPTQFNSATAQPLQSSHNAQSTEPGSTTHTDSTSTQPTASTTNKTDFITSTRLNRRTIIPLLAVFTLVGGYLVYAAFATVPAGSVASCKLDNAKLPSDLRGGAKPKAVGSYNTNAYDLRCLENTNELKVVKMVKVVFNRMPRQDEISIGAKILEDNGSDYNAVRKLAEQLIELPEFKSSYGSDLTTAQFVTAMYKNTYGEEPSSELLDRYVKAIDESDWYNNGRWSRKVMVEFLAGSVENTKHADKFIDALLNNPAPGSVTLVEENQPQQEASQASSCNGELRTEGSDTWCYVSFAKAAELLPEGVASQSSSNPLQALPTYGFKPIPVNRAPIDIEGYTRQIKLFGHHGFTGGVVYLNSTIYGDVTYKLVGAGGFDTYPMPINTTNYATFNELSPYEDTNQAKPKIHAIGKEYSQSVRCTYFRRMCNLFFMVDPNQASKAQLENTQVAIKVNPTKFYSTPAMADEAVDLVESNAENYVIGPNGRASVIDTNTCTRPIDSWFFQPSDYSRSEPARSAIHTGTKAGVGKENGVSPGLFNKCRNLFLPSHGSLKRLADGTYTHNSSSVVPNTYRFTSQRPLPKGSMFKIDGWGEKAVAQVKSEYDLRRDESFMGIYLNELKQDKFSDRDLRFNVEVLGIDNQPLRPGTDYKLDVPGASKQYSEDPTTGRTTETVGYDSVDKKTFSIEFLSVTPVKPIVNITAYVVGGDSVTESGQIDETELYALSDPVFESSWKSHSKVVDHYKNRPKSLNFVPDRPDPTKLEIGIIGGEITPELQPVFAQQSEKVIARIKNTEPYKSKTDKLKFKTIFTSRAVGFKTVTEHLLDEGIYADKWLILDPGTTDSGTASSDAGGAVAPLMDSGRWPGVPIPELIAVHELGHLIGNLTDEYYDTESSGGNNDQRHAQCIGYDREQYERFPDDTWREIQGPWSRFKNVPNVNWTGICGGTGWLKPDVASIMDSVSDVSSRQFNSASRLLVSEAIDCFSSGGIKYTENISKYFFNEDTGRNEFIDEPESCQR